MSLQNKANTFFGAQQSDAAASDEVEDIFEQYGSGTVATAVASDDASTHVNDVDTDSASETRAWEREFAQQDHDAAPSPAPSSTRPVPAPEPSMPPEESPYPAPMPTPAPTPTPTHDATIDPIVTHAAPTQPPIADTPPQPHTPTTPSPAATERAPQDVVQEPKQTEEEPEESVRYTAPVAAPVQRNINAVIENAPDASVKKSVMPHIPSTLPQTVDPSKKTILIVDDDVDTLEMYATIFEGADYNVLRAADGLEALSLIASYTPHVIFTGMVMPRMDGFTMIDALRQNERTSEIPVVINSHLGRAADKKRAEELGVRDFIVRGFTTPREVVERIGALLLRSEYSFHFDVNDPEVRKLAKDLGTSNFFTCPRGQEMVIKLSIVDPRELTFSARFSCVDAPSDKK